MKILHVIPPTNIGPIDKNFHTAGMIQSVWLLDKFLVEKGHESYVAWSKNSKIHGQLIPIIDDLKVETIREPKKEIFNNYYEKILDIVNKSSFDIVHNHMSRPLTYKKYQSNVLTLRLPIEYFKKIAGKMDDRFISESIPFSVFTAALTYKQARGYIENGFFVDRVVNNGIDLNEYSIGNNKRKYLLTIARILPDKGQDTAIDVAHKTGLPLIIAGDIWDKKYFAEKIEPYIDGNFIKYLGPVDFETKVKLYQSASALLVPVKWEEPFNLTMVEAMACGTPVIGFRHGAIAEVIEDGKTGFVVNSVEEMIESVKKVSDINGMICRRRVEENFNIEKTVNQYEAVYKIMKDNRPFHKFIYQMERFIPTFKNGNGKFKSYRNFLRKLIF